MNVVLKKADVLAADTVNEMENRLTGWKEKQWSLEEVGEPDQHFACRRNGTLAEERSHEK